MGIFSKLMTAVRGHATEAGQSLVDANAVTILRQEIIDSKSNVRKSEEALTKIMADKTIAEDKLSSLNKDADNWLSHAKQAKAKEDMDLARQCAEKVADFRNQAAQHEEIVAGFAESVSTLNQAIRETRGQIKSIEQKINSIEATAKVQKAQESLSKHMNSGKGQVSSALDSIDRIEERQKHKSAQLKASKELSTDPDDALKKRLADSGIGSTSAAADDILNDL
jgi:phage shock protein A